MMNENKNMSSQQKKFPFKAIILTVLSVILGIIIFIAFQIALFNFANDVTYGNNYRSGYVAQCERTYGGRKYGELYELLYRNQAYMDERFGKYVEIIDAYEAYMEYEYCSEEEKASKKEALESIAENIQYSENESQINKWVAKTE